MVSEFGIRANFEWWPGRASRDQHGRDQRGLGVVAWKSHP